MRMSNGSFPINKDTLGEQVRRACGDILDGLRSLVTPSLPVLAASTTTQGMQTVRAELIRVPQMARPQKHDSEDYQYAYIKRQQEISANMRESRDAAVVVDGLRDDLNSHVYSWMKGLRNGSVLAHANAVFAEGIPEPSRNISAEQRALLVLHGAPTVMWLLGVVPTIHRSIDPERIREIDLEVSTRARTRYGSEWREKIQGDPELSTLAPLKIAEATTERLERLLVTGVPRVIFIASDSAR
jgi:hypothetical protein